MIFIQSLKSQVSTTMADDDDETTTASDIESLRMKNKDELLQAIKILDKKINAFQRKTLAHYISLGDNLFKLKMLYIIKCDDCILDEKEADCMACRKCAQQSDSKGFFKDVKNVVSYVNSHINFLINIGKLGKSYSKFKNISCCVSQLRTHITSLRKQMAIDVEFWK